MAYIITIAHQKGGVGKSTLALNLALAFQHQLTVALIDADVQGSLIHSRDDFPSLDVFGAETLNTPDQLEHQLIIIDTPPYLTSKLPELFLKSDFVLVPTKAGIFDVLAIRSTLELIKTAQMKTPQLKAGIVLNMLKPRSGLTHDVSNMLAQMEVPLLNARIHDRVSIAKSSLTGGILGGTDTKAKEEILALAEEVIDSIVAN